MPAKDTVETVYRAFATGDVPTALGLLDDKVEWTEAAGFPYSGTYHCPQAVLAGVFAFSARFAHAWTINSGKILRFEQVVDSAEVNKAL